MLFQCAGRGGVRSYGLQNLKETADDNTYDFLSCRLFSLCRGRALDPAKYIVESVRLERTRHG